MAYLPTIWLICMANLRRQIFQNTDYHGNPKPSFLGVITHILGCKTFIFYGFGVQGYMIWVLMTNNNPAAAVSILHVLYVL